MTKTPDEKRTAGASYILTFYKDIGALNQYFANYLNTLLELENKYPDGGSFEKAQPDEKERLAQTTQIVRYAAHIVMVEYRAIKKNLKLKDPEQKTIEESYKEISSQFVIDREHLDKFVTGMNAALVGDVIQDLLVSSQEIVGEVFGDGPADTS